MVRAIVAFCLGAVTTILSRVHICDCNDLRLEPDLFQEVARFRLIPVFVTICPTTRGRKITGTKNSIQTRPITRLNQQNCWNKLLPIDLVPTIKQADHMLDCSEVVDNINSFKKMDSISPWQKYHRCASFLSNEHPKQSSQILHNFLVGGFPYELLSRKKHGKLKQLFCLVHCFHCLSLPAQTLQICPVEARLP